ncbi:hypothetical protein INR49_007112 [Caranx melampygus]|nr:hypothetical protein INR49_007112 [Caranx melampygus]
MIRGGGDSEGTRRLSLTARVVSCQLVQVIINTTHLEQSCHFLEEFISNITNVPPDTVNATKLYGTSTFKDARHAAEAEIYTSLNAKIDQFLQLADYDWLAPVQGGGTLAASDYLIDLIAFLKSTFSVFTNLPGEPLGSAAADYAAAQDIDSTARRR